MNPKDLTTFDEATIRCNIPPSKLYALIDAGHVDTYTGDTGNIMVSITQILATKHLTQPQTDDRIRSMQHHPSRWKPTTITDKFKTIIGTFRIIANMFHEPESADHLEQHATDAQLVGAVLILVTEDDDENRAYTWSATGMDDESVMFATKVIERQLLEPDD